jgi:hypothetical protein
VKWDRKGSGYRPKNRQSVGHRYAGIDLGGIDEVVCVLGASSISDSLVWLKALSYNCERYRCR